MDASWRRWRDPEHWRDLGETVIGLASLYVATGGIWPATVASDAYYRAVNWGFAATMALLVCRRRDAWATARALPWIWLYPGFAAGAAVVSLITNGEATYSATLGLGTSLGLLLASRYSL